MSAPAGTMTLSAADAASALAFLKDAYGVLGLDAGRHRVLEAKDAAAHLPETVRLLLEAREAARKGRDFAAADRLRDELLDAGVRVKDTKVGQEVRKGEIIGVVGSTGRSTGYHLHYEVRIKDEPVDPTPYMVELAQQADLAARLERSLLRGARSREGAGVAN